MSKFKVDGKNIVSISKNEDGVISSFRTEDGKTIPYYVMVVLAGRDRTEGLVLHQNQDGRFILSAKRGSVDEVDSALEDLPVHEDKTEEGPWEISVNGKKIVAIKEDNEGNISEFKDETGKVLSYSEVIEEILEGNTEGLNLHYGSNGRDIISAVRNTVPDNLESLPRF